MLVDLNYLILKTKCGDCGLVIMTIFIFLMLIWYGFVTIARNNDRSDRLGIEIHETKSSLEFWKDSETFIVLVETQPDFILNPVRRIFLQFLQRDQLQLKHLERCLKSWADI